MSTVPESLLGIGEWFEPGYKPILDFSGWRVAILRYIDSVDPANINQIERHRETNEVFVLTAGQADLILFAGGDTPSDEYYVFPMELNVAYNIQQGVWHHSVLSKDAHILLVERTDTSMSNSNYAPLSPEQIKDIRSKLTVKST